MVAVHTSKPSYASHAVATLPTWLPWFPKQPRPSCVKAGMLFLPCSFTCTSFCTVAEMSLPKKICSLPYFSTGRQYCLGLVALLWKEKVDFTKCPNQKHLEPLHLHRMFLGSSEWTWIGWISRLYITLVRKKWRFYVQQQVTFWA